MIGTIIGIVGLAVGLFSLWRSRTSGMIAVQSHDVPMIGGGDAVFPDEVEVRYRGTSVPQLTSSTVWIWNAGQKAVRSSDLTPHDPLQLHFAGEVLNVRRRKVSHDATRIRADPEMRAADGEPRKTIHLNFDFLNAGDGAVFEVLHSGSAEAPKCTGTIVGLRKGPQYWGRAWATSVYSRVNRRVTLFLGIAIAVAGLGVVALGILGEPYITDVLLLFVDPEDLDPTEVPPSWSLVLVGCLFVFQTLRPLWKLRRRSPSSLNIEAVK